MNTIVVTPTVQNDAAFSLQSLIRTRPCFQATEVITFDRMTVRRDSWPPLAFIILDEDHSDIALAALRQLREGGVKHLLVVGPATDPKLILRSIQTGADLFLDQTDLELELELALNRLQIRRTDGERTKQLLAVLSAAGGCGASTVAVNVAALIAKAHGQCNLIDLNAGKADLAPLLDLKPQYTLADLCRNDGRLDRSLYEKLLTRHESGVALLAAPAELDQGEDVTPRGVARAVALAREAFADVVVDLHDCRHDDQWVVLEQATRILIVCRPDYTSVRSTRRVLDHLSARGIPSDRVDVVMNQTGLANEILAADAEAALGRSVRFFVPHDPEVVNAANNTGAPLALTHSHSTVAQSLAHIVGLEEPAVPSRARIARMAADAHGHVVSHLRTLFQRLVKPKESIRQVLHPIGLAASGVRSQPALKAEVYALDT